MVQFYGLLISNEIFLLTIFVPIAFAFWYYRRVLGSRKTLVVYDDDSGDGTLWPAFWSIVDKTVTMKRGRGKKNEVILKKVGAPKRMFVPPYSTQIWFRAKEGSNETVAWPEHKDGSAKFDLGYEVASMTHHWLDQIKTSLGLSIKNPIVYMALLGGFGIGAFVLFLIMIFTGNMGGGV